MQRIYFDHNASSPPPPQVVAAMLPYLREHSGNPSSTHASGQQARRAIDGARRQVAAAVGASQTELFFVSGGTEANNLALCGVVERRLLSKPPRRQHIVTSAVEHPAVLAACERLRRFGVAVTIAAVDRQGRVDPAEIERALTDDTVLVSLMLANNDVGTLQPVTEVAQLLRPRGVLLHTDAVQALGKVPIDMQALGVDLLSLSAHKIGGPKGTGALVIRRGVEVATQICGGGQERGRRGGTENVPGIVGFGRACELLGEDLEQRTAQVSGLRDYLQREILARVPQTRANGHPGLRLPNTLSVTFFGVEGAALAMNLDLAGVACSVGSACASGRVEPSHVLTAMGLSAADALATVRFSLGGGNTRQEVDAVLEKLQEAVGRLRRVTGGDDEAVRYGRSRR